MFFKNIDIGVKYMLLSSILFAFMGAFAKLSSQSMSSIEVVFFRNIFGVIIISYTIYKTGLSGVGGKPFLLFFRGFMGFVALLAFFYNIAHIPLSDAMTFTKTAPIFTAIFAYIFLKEHLSFYAWVGVFIGFIGIVFITQPSGFSFSKTDLLGIFSGLGAALAYTSVRELKKIYDTKAIVLSFMLIGSVGPLILMLSAEFINIKDFDFILAPFVMPKGITWFYISAMGLFATLAQVYMTKAYGETKAGIIGAISYSNIIFSIILGVILGDAFPNYLTIIGIILIIISGLSVNIKDKK